jgi:hypothetical protein
MKTLLKQINDDASSDLGAESGFIVLNSNLNWKAGVFGRGWTSQMSCYKIVRDVTIKLNGIGNSVSVSRKKGGGGRDNRIENFPSHKSWLSASVSIPSACIMDGFIPLRSYHVPTIRTIIWHRLYRCAVFCILHFVRLSNAQYIATLLRQIEWFVCYLMTLHQLQN